MIKMLPTIMLTAIQNITYPSCTTLTCLMQWSNTTTSGLLGMIINGVIFFIAFAGMLLSGIDLEQAGLVAGFISLFVALALVGMSILNPLFIMVWIGVMALFFILSWTKGASNPYG